MKRTVASVQELGTRLSEARKAAGLTQADLGREVGLDRTAITKIEAGTRRVDSLELSRIAEALRRPVDWFLIPDSSATPRRQQAIRA